MILNELTTDLNHNIDRVWTGLVAGGRTAWLAGLGVAGTVADETTHVWDLLVEKGKAHDPKPLELVGDATKKMNLMVKDLGEKVEDRVEGTTAKVLQRFGIPSRSEVRSLIDRVERLNAKLATMNP